MSSLPVVCLRPIALFAFDTMAMGNYPYESTYLTHGEVALPAFPVRAACEHLAGPLDGDEALLAALAAAASSAASIPRIVGSLRGA